MSDKSGVDLFEEWQTGAFLVVGSAIFGVILGAIGGSVSGQIGGLSGFVGGFILGFLVLSYLLYGR